MSLNFEQILKSTIHISEFENCQFDGYFYEPKNRRIYKEEFDQSTNQYIYKPLRMKYIIGTRFTDVDEVEHRINKTKLIRDIRTKINLAREILEELDNETIMGRLHNTDESFERISDMIEEKYPELSEDSKVLINDAIYYLIQNM